MIDARAQRDSARARAFKVLPGGSVALFDTTGQTTPIIAYGEGSKVYDVEGKEYVDYLLGSGPMLLGHAHPAVTKAIQLQASRGTTFYSTTPPAIELAERMVAAIPCAEQVRFTSTGSEATLQAIRYAKAATGRTKILRFAGSFNGGHDYALMDVGAKAEFSGRLPAMPLSAGLSPGIRNEVLLAPYNDLKTTSRVAREAADDLAAILVEPLQRYIPPQEDFLPGLRRIADELGALLIFDEVVTGFRLAYGGAQEYYNVVPDLACYGKVIGGGLPIGAVCGPKSLMSLCVKPEADPLKWVYHGGTFSGNPLSAAAGAATLAELRRPGVYRRLHEQGEYIRNELTRIFEKAGLLAAVPGDGPIIGLVFGTKQVRSAADIRPEHKAKTVEFLTRLLAEGIYVNPTGSKLYLSAVHSDEDIERLLSASRRVVSQM